MSVKIRLMRVGKKKQPSYRVVIADGRSPRDGRYIEIIGHYRPRQEPSAFEVDGDKVIAWLEKGAQPSPQVHRLLVGSGLWETYEAGRRSPSLAARVAGRKSRGQAEAAKAKAAAEAQEAAAAKAKAAAEAQEAAAAKENADAPDEPGASDDTPTDETATDES